MSLLVSEKPLSAQTATTTTLIPFNPLSRPLEKGREMVLFWAALIWLITFSLFAGEIQVNIQPENRVPNRTGVQCVWSSLEALARHHGVKPASNLTSRYKSQTLPHIAAQVLDQLDVDYYMTPPTFGKKNKEFLVNSCANGWGAVVGLNRQHAIVVVGFNDGKVYYFDNLDAKLEMREWTEAYFMQIWDGWALTLVPPSELAKGEF